MTYVDSLTALSDPRRRAIFEALRQGPMSVSQIASGQPVSRPAVSQHLKVLQQAGLVSVTAKGTKRVYHLRREGLSGLRGYVESFWSDALDAFADHISTTQKEPSMLPPVIKTITVPCPPAQAFQLFTRDIASWWPLDKNSVSAMSGKVARDIELDPREGGEITEIDHEGARVLWGSITDYSPPSRLGLAWHINRPASEATSVTVTFEADDDPASSGTKVTLIHAGWEVFGDDAQSMRNGYDSGWVHVFEQRFKAACS